LESQLYYNRSFGEIVQYVSVKFTLEKNHCLGFLCNPKTFSSTLQKVSVQTYYTEVLYSYKFIFA